MSKKPRAPAKPHVLITHADLTASIRGVVRDELRAVVRDELRNVGFRTDDDEHSDRLRNDIEFAGKLRRVFDAAAGKVGGAILLALLSVVFAAIALGTQAAVRLYSGTAAQP